MISMIMKTVKMKKKKKNQRKKIMDNKLPILAKKNILMARQMHNFKTKTRNLKYKLK